MTIRQAGQKDYDAVWDIFSTVIQTEDTYVFTADTPKKDLARHWFADTMQSFVAEENGIVLGTYILKPNQIGLGNHIANCSYMVHPEAQGKGIGRALCEHSINTARDSNYAAIQFNMVISTNKRAITLWETFGFRIIGITPRGFRHRELGYVDTCIMYKAL